MGTEGGPVPVSSSGPAALSTPVSPVSMLQEGTWSIEAVLM